MPFPTTPATDSLRRLTLPHALRFSSALLLRCTDGTITFKEFVAVARELVAQSSEDAAVFLAAMIAIDMSHEDDAAADRFEPSPN